jgi:hypothetical protein
MRKQSSQLGGEPGDPAGQFRHRQARAVLQLGQDPQVDVVEQALFVIVGG